MPGWICSVFSGLIGLPGCSGTNRASVPTARAIRPMRISNARLSMASLSGSLQPPAGWRGGLVKYYGRKQAVKQSDATVTVLRVGLFFLAMALYVLT